LYILVLARCQHALPLSDEMIDEELFFLANRVQRGFEPLPRGNRRSTIKTVAGTWFGADFVSYPQEQQYQMPTSPHDEAPTTVENEIKNRSVQALMSS
jgi:hypothetical protein